MADTITHSPLVKTDFFGQDANWGRILAAAGRAGIPLDPERLDLYFDDVQMVAGGVGCGPATEDQTTDVLKQAAFTVTLDLNQGQASTAFNLRFFAGLRQDQCGLSHLTPRIK